jgi:hypothetical protein
MNNNDPIVKEMANFRGFNASIGNPTANAKTKNKADRNNKAQNTCDWFFHEIQEEKNVI